MPKIQLLTVKCDDSVLFTNNGSPYPAKWPFMETGQPNVRYLAWAACVEEMRERHDDL